MAAAACSVAGEELDCLAENPEDCHQPDLFRLVLTKSTSQISLSPETKYYLHLPAKIEDLI